MDGLTAKTCNQIAVIFGEYMGNTGKRGPYPKGPKKQADAEWKEKVRAAMEAQEVTFRDLAALLKIKNHTGLVKLLDPRRKQNTSSLVPKINDVLGIKDRQFTELEIRIIDAFRQADERTQASVLVQCGLAEVTPRG